MGSNRSSLGPKSSSFHRCHPLWTVPTRPRANRSSDRRPDQERASRLFQELAYRTHQPPSANQDNWRKGSNSSRKTRVLAIPERYMAEGGETASLLMCISI